MNLRHALTATLEAHYQMHGGRFESCHCNWMGDRFLEHLVEKLTECVRESEKVGYERIDLSENVVTADGHVYKVDEIRTLAARRSEVAKTWPQPDGVRDVDELRKWVMYGDYSDVWEPWHSLIEAWEAT